MTDFGRDISCTTSIRAGRFSTGARLVAESVYRRLTTPRGALRGGEEEANYGLDLLDMIGSSTTKKDLAALPGRIRAELSKDERVGTATVDVLDVSTGPSKSVLITIEVTTIAGPFSLQLGVDEVTVELLKIEA